MARCLAWNCASSIVVDEHDWVGVQPLNAIAVVISIKPCWKSNAHFEGVTQAKKKEKASNHSVNLSSRLF